MLQLRINKQPKFGQFYTAAEIRWSVQRWLNEKQLHCFYFHPSKQDCFELKGPCQHQDIIKETSVNNAIKQTDCPESARRWQAPFNPEQSCFDGWK